jgi:hypothetical protein
MLGYITPDKPELKIKEFEIYGGYYCGICRSIGRRYGQLPRLVLSYDSVLLALLHAGIHPESDNIQISRCMVHPLKKRTIVTDSPEIDNAADILLLLAFYKFQDDAKDKKSKTAAIGAAYLNSVYKKLYEKRPEQCREVQNRLRELALLEEEHCSSIDRAAEPFAKLMEEVFDPGTLLIHSRFCDEEMKAIYRRIGYHLGKWIYIVDAFDDIEENINDQSYNPILCQFQYDEKKESPNDFRIRVRDRIEMNLMLYLAETAKCCKQLEIQKNKGLIDNIIYLGLLRKTEEILKKGNTEDAKSI